MGTDVGVVDRLTVGTLVTIWKSTPLDACTQVGGSGQTHVIVGWTEIKAEGTAEGVCEGAEEGISNVSFPNRLACVGDTLGELDGCKLGATLTEGDWLGAAETLGMLERVGVSDGTELGAELGLSVQTHPRVGDVLGTSLGALDIEGAIDTEGDIETLGGSLGELDTEGELLGATD